MKTSQVFTSAVHLPAVEGYDVIGDVHGCAVTLERLLQRLGYSKNRGVYGHKNRRALFLGDLIDRGPRIREVALLVQAMVERGSAEMVLGNHEFNALLYCTKAEDGTTYLRSHSASHTRQITETLEQFANHADDWSALLKWFRSLPLFLEFNTVDEHPVFRAVHACWDHAVIAQHRARYGSGYFDEAFVVASAQPGSIEAHTRQRLLAGVDMPLPEGVKVLSSDGYERSNFRTKFWVQQAATYGDLLFQPDPLPEHVAREQISQENRHRMVHYANHEPPLFIGHYWLKGNPKPIAPNIACLDYSAVKYGRLVAYRMDGEQQLQIEKFVWEYVDP